jgi:hypothetical protein
VLLNFGTIQSVPVEKMNIVGHSIGHSKQKIYMYICLIQNGFQDRAVDVIAHIKEHQDALRRVARCIDVDGGIFKIVLY